VTDGVGGADADGAGAAPPLHELEFRLSWGECDPAGIVYYATYLEWAERAQSEWWYLNGRAITAPGASTAPSFVVRHVSCDYLAAPRPMDLVRLSLRTERIGTTSFTLAFDFARADTGAALARLSLTAVFVDADLQPVGVPDDAVALLRGGAAT